MTDLQKLVQLKDQAKEMKGLSSTERNRRNQFVKTVEKLEDGYKKATGGRVQTSIEQKTVESIETQAYQLKKAIGRKGVNTIITTQEGYKAFKTGEKNVKERERIDTTRIRRETTGTQEYREERMRLKELKIENVRKYLKKRRGMRNISNEEKKFITNLVLERGYNVTEFRDKTSTKKVIVQEFENAFISGKMAVFKRYKGEFINDDGEMKTIQSKLDAFREKLENDPNAIRNYARFEEYFFNKVLPALYEEIRRLRGPGAKATPEEIARAFDKALTEYDRIVAGRTKGARVIKNKRSK